MKNNILLYLLSIILSSLLSSCASENFFPSDNSETNLISFEVSVPVSEMRTRGFSDGSMISELYCYVYQINATSPLMTLPVEIKTTDGKRGGTLDLSLPSGGIYDFVFLATSGPQNNSAYKIYFDTNARTLQVNYEKIYTNDEDVDCFLGVLKEISIAKGITHKVTLKRPFAQLNIGTKDLDIYNAMASSSLQKVGVKVDGIYSSLNVMDGNVIGDPIRVSLAASTIPTGQTFPAKDTKYLSMNYLLVNTRKNVDVTMTASNASSSFDVEFSSVPLQRNCQTNIYGNLLTKANDFKVEINPEFDGSGLKDVDDPWAEYDLVLKISTQHSARNVIPLKATSSDGKIKSFDLSSYKDSQNYIKLNWEQLGLSNIQNISFHYSSSVSNYIAEFLKCNIEKLGITDLSHILDTSLHLTNTDALTKWDTSNVTDMSYMFYECGNLTSLDLSNFNTTNVTSMRSMFFNCNKLTSIDLSSFNTSNVTDMSLMFYFCYGLASLDLSSFNTANVKAMRQMFYFCSGLTSLDLSSFNTSNVTDMSLMFRNCSGLTSLDLSNFNTTNVTDMHEMFSESNRLTSLDLSNFNTTNVTDMSLMFYNCNKLASLDLSSFNTANVTDMSQMFCSCRGLTSLDLSSFNTANVTDMSQMFSLCSGLTSLNLSSFNTTNVKTMEMMFLDCTKLTSLDLSDFNNTNVTNMRQIFRNCSGLTSLNLSNFNTPNVIGMSEMFYNCNKLTSLDLSSFNTSTVTNMSQMFAYCSGLTSLDLSNFNTTNVTSMSLMFTHCSGLTSIDLSSFNTSNVTNMSQMFAYCSGLNLLDLSSFDTRNVTSMTKMFYDCPATVIWGPNGGVR